MLKFSGKKIPSKSYQSNPLHCKFCNDGDSERSNGLFKALVQNTLMGKNREIEQYSNVHLKDAWRFRAYWLWHPASNSQWPNTQLVLCALLSRTATFLWFAFSLHLLYTKLSRKSDFEFISRNSKSVHYFGGSYKHSYSFFDIGGTYSTLGHNHYCAVFCWA